jgi:integrase/recombinase XerD
MDMPRVGGNRPGSRVADRLVRFRLVTHAYRKDTNNGADIRFVQQMLGHEDLKTTQRYTLVAVKKLREVHGRTHPAGSGRGLWREER